MTAFTPGAGPIPLPDLPPAFEWSRAPWGPVLRCPALAAIVGNHGFTTRQLVLQGPDSACAAQWTALADAAGVRLGDIVRLVQVHGPDVSLVGEGGLAGDTRRADAVVTGRDDVLLTVRVADCVPLLLADARSGVVAAVHAGWRGTAASIARNAVGRLASGVGADPSSLVAAIGPSVGPCCYTVGPELEQAFRAAGHAELDLRRWFTDGAPQRLDLWAANRDQLIAAGLRPDAVHVARLCTACRADLFYSYRREGAAAGRLVAFIRARHRP